MLTLDDDALNLVFCHARSYNRWRDEAPNEADLRAIHDLARMGPTTANSCPARFVFLCSEEGKERLRPHLSAGNIGKVMTAPVTTIIGHDLAFYDHLHKLFPHVDARP